MATDDRIGQLIVNRYRLSSVLGEGAMGKVYLAKDRRLSKLVALKFLNQTLQTPELCDRFHLEARACAQLGSRSDYIVEVTDYGVDANDVPFHVMEYLQGESLRSRLKQQPLSLSQFLNLSQQICLGLQCAHQGMQLGDSETFYPVIHCDIKPSNVFVLPDQMLSERARILDFGIARLLTADQQARCFNGGTLPYCSPEQIAGDPLDTRTDIYSLRVMLFEMLTGKLPLYSKVQDQFGWMEAHHSQTPRTFEAVVPGLAIPQPLKDLVLDCLRKSPDRRPQSIGEVLDVLRSLSQSSGVVQPVEHQTHRTAKLKVVHPAAQPGQTVDSNLPVCPPELQSSRILCKPCSYPEPLPTLWVKLPHHQIQTIQIYRLYNQIYQNFLVCSYPHHPMLLWLTAIHTPHQNWLWFPAFVDLKTRAGLETLRLLGQTRQYQILFFDQEEPHWYSHRIIRELEPMQLPKLSQLKQQVLTSPKVTTGSPVRSQQVLDAKFRELKLEVERQRFNE